MSQLLYAERSCAAETHTPADFEHRCGWVEQIRLAWLS